eukprot:6214631-Pleurochrysis_carterae.AAC.1
MPRWQCTSTEPPEPRAAWMNCTPSVIAECIRGKSEACAGDGKGMEQGCASCWTGCGRAACKPGATPSCMHASRYAQHRA